MAYTIAVCDDDQAVSKQISLYLKQVETELGKEFNTFYYSSAEDLLRFMPKETQIIFLDIQMGRMSGIEAAKVLRKRGCEAAILFITNMTEYALEGYEVHAFAFLCKPVQYAPFRRNLAEIIKRLDTEDEAFIRVSFGTSHQILKLKDLYYVEVLGHETSFVTKQGRKTCKMPLSEIESQTLGKGFFRCHKSYLINLRYITAIEPVSVIMEDSASIPISKYRKKEFLREYSLYSGIML